MRIGGSSTTEVHPLRPGRRGPHRQGGPHGAVWTRADRTPARLATKDLPEERGVIGREAVHRVCAEVEGCNRGT